MHLRPPSTVSLILIFILTNAARPKRRHSFVVPSLHSHGLDPLSLASVIVLSRQIENFLSRVLGTQSLLHSVHYLPNMRHFRCSIFFFTIRPSRKGETRKCPKDHVLCFVDDMFQFWFWVLMRLAALRPKSCSTVLLWRY